MNADNLNVNLNDLLSERKKQKEAVKSEILNGVSPEEVYLNFQEFEKIIEKLSSEHIKKESLNSKNAFAMYCDFFDDCEVMGIMSKLLFVVNFCYFITYSSPSQVYLLLFLPYLIFLWCFLHSRKAKIKQIDAQYELFNSEKNQQTVKEIDILQEKVTPEFIKDLLKTNYQFINMQTGKFVDEEFENNKDDKSLLSHLKNIRKKILGNVETINLNLISQDMRILKNK